MFDFDLIVVGAGPGGYEAALHAACEKFIRRFALVERSAGEQALTSLTEAQLIELWNLAKAASEKENQ